MIDFFLVHFFLLRNQLFVKPWWHHHMQMISALLALARGMPWWLGMNNDSDVEPSYGETPNEWFATLCSFFYKWPWYLPKNDTTNNHKPNSCGRATFRRIAPFIQSRIQCWNKQPVGRLPVIMISIFIITPGATIGRACLYFIKDRLTCLVCLIHGNGQIIVLHKFLWDVIAHPCHNIEGTLSKWFFMCNITANHDIHLHFQARILYRQGLPVFSRHQDYLFSLCEIRVRMDNCIAYFSERCSCSTMS